MLKIKKEDKIENPHARNRNVQIRMSEAEYMELKQKAALLADGNCSLLIRAALKNYIPTKEDLVFKPRP